MAHAPESRSRIVRAWCAAAALGLLLSQAVGCGEDPPEPDPDPAVAEDQAADRQRKAGVLHRQAMATAIPEKFDVYRRLIALYDDTPFGQDAYLELIVALTRDAPPKPAEALKIAEMFARRHPTDPRVSEGFLQVADTAYGTHEESVRKAALDAWSDFLENHDVAGDLPKADVFREMVRLRLRQERWEDAEVAIDTALGEPGITGGDRVEILLRKGTLLADKLGRKDDALVALREALVLSTELAAARERRPGAVPAQIEEEIRRIEGR